MKVCTDACLFGALVARTNLNNARCLDIGAGTGLLSLMVAQQNEAVQIDAIELDPNAAEQSKENISASPWAERIQVHHTDILLLKTDKPYNFIFSNPPFYQDDLWSPDQQKNNAKHNGTLNLKQLVSVAHSLLAADGRFALLLPFKLVDQFIEDAQEAGFHLSYKLLVKQTLKHKYFRGILIFSKKPEEAKYDELIIKDLEHNYTPEFTAYLKDYYLFL